MLKTMIHQCRSVPAFDASADAGAGAVGGIHISRTFFPIRTGTSDRPGPAPNPNCPLGLSPNVQMVPVLSTTNDWKQPAPILHPFGMESTCTGSDRLMVSPVPSMPKWFFPHAQRPPLLSRARVCQLPQTTVSIPGRSSTRDGVVRNVPIVSWCWVAGSDPQAQITPLLSNAME